MWKEKLIEFLHWRYGDTFTNILTGAGFLTLLYTLLVYIDEDRLNVLTLVVGLMFLIGGILYKELVYDKDIENEGKG